MTTIIFDMKAEEERREALNAIRFLAGKAPVTDEEWEALKVRSAQTQRAILRMRERAEEAERERAAALLARRVKS